jgi:hypothetical protein
MTNARRVGEALASLPKRWLIGVEIGIGLQLLAGGWLVRTLRDSGGIVSEIAGVLVLAGLMALSGAVIALSVWRDTHFVDGHTDWSPRPLFWVLLCVAVPVLVPIVYLRRRHSATGITRHGLSGLFVWLVASLGGSSQGTEANSPSADIDAALESELPPVERLTPRETGYSGIEYEGFLSDGTGVTLKLPSHEGPLPQAVSETFRQTATDWERIDEHDRVVELLEWGEAPYPWLLEKSTDVALSSTDLSIEETISALVGICNGFHHAHKHGVCHHGLRPASVHLIDAGEGESVQIGDWGVSRCLLEAMEGSDQGAPEYAAPEQLRPGVYGDPDERTDVYQVGALGYHLLTGRRMYEQDELGSPDAMLSDTVTPPSEVDDRIPSELDAVFTKATAPTRADRYDTVLALRKAISDAL